MITSFHYHHVRRAIIGELYITHLTILGRCGVVVNNRKCGVDHVMVVNVIQWIRFRPRDGLVVNELQRIRCRPRDGLVVNVLQGIRFRPRDGVVVNVLQNENGCFILRELFPCTLLCTIYTIYKYREIMSWNVVECSSVLTTQGHVTHWSLGVTRKPCVSQ